MFGGSKGHRDVFELRAQHDGRVRSASCAAYPDQLRKPGLGHIDSVKKCAPLGLGLCGSGTQSDDFAELVHHNLLVKVQLQTVCRPRWRGEDVIGDRACQAALLEVLPIEPALRVTWNTCVTFQLFGQCQTPICGCRRNNWIQMLTSQMYRTDHASFDSEQVPPVYRHGSLKRILC